MECPENPENEGQKQHLQEKYTSRISMRDIQLLQSRGAGLVAPGPPSCVHLLCAPTMTRKQMAESAASSSTLFLLNPGLLWISDHRSTSRAAVDAGNTGKPSSDFDFAGGRWEL